MWWLCCVCICLLMSVDVSTIRRREVNVKSIGLLNDIPAWNFWLKSTLAVAESSIALRSDINISYHLVGRFCELGPQDALEAGEKTCTLMEQNSDLTGVIAPFDDDSLRYVQAACERLDVPLLVARAAPHAARSATAVNLFPHYSVFTEVGAGVSVSAVIELIKLKGWESFTVIYEEAEGLERLAAVLGLHGQAGEAYVMSARQLPSGDNFRSLLLVMKDSGAENFVVDCRTERVERFLQQAQQVGIISEPYAYIFTNPDLQTVSLESYSHGSANITGFRLFDVESPYILNFTSALKEEYNDLVSRDDQSSRFLLQQLAPQRLPAVLPLTYDAVRLHAAALDKFSDLTERALSCESGSGLEFGSTLINHIRTMSMNGLTGAIHFDEEGDRYDVILEVLELNEGGNLLKIGNWSKSKSGENELMIERPPLQPSTDEETDSMKTKTFTVLITLTAPYGMRRESFEKLDGNQRYEGFCVELIQELAAILGFQYVFQVQEDGKSGSYNEATKEWDGMLRQVMDGKVDFAIADLTMNGERESAVDFTTPFMNLGISILFRTPKKPSPGILSFMLPFSSGVWLSLGAAYLGCSVLLYVLGRICPDEWQNPYPCVEEPEALENQFTLANALWFNLGALLQQGSEIAPVAYGTRAVASMWWFFALIITSSYTANLATLLSSVTKEQPIHNAEELAHNTLNISYGAKIGGSTYSFFKGSNNPLYREMYQYMTDHPDQMCDTTENATYRVLNENYAFFMESTSIEYLVERNCDLEQVGQLLDNKGYAIAMKKGSIYRQKLNLALLNLQEQGKMASMKKKWWKEQRGGGVCDETDDSSSAELDLKSVSGVFIVLVVGCVLGLIVSFVDMTMHVYRRARQYQIPFKKEFKRELKFVFTFNATTKPMRHGRSSSGTDSNQALTLQSLPTTPERESVQVSPSQSPEARDRSPAQVESRRQSAHKGSRQTSLRSRTGRRRSTMHNTSVKLARQSIRE